MAFSQVRKYLHSQLSGLERGKNRTGRVLQILQLSETSSVIERSDSSRGIFRKIVYDKGHGQQNDAFKSLIRNLKNRVDDLSSSAGSKIINRQIKNTTLSVPSNLSPNTV